MQRLKNSWFLVRFDLIRHGLGYILSVLFYGYASGMVLLMFHDTESKEASSLGGANSIIDFYFLFIVGISGFAFASRYYRGYCKNKSFSKKAIFLKSYPISARDTIESKLLAILIHVLGQGGLFFIVIYLVPSPLQKMLNASQFIGFMVMWLAYGLVWGCIYAYMEISLSEKAYLWGGIGIALFFTLVVYLSWLADYPLIQHTIGWIQQYGIWIPLISLAISAAVFIIFRTAGIRKILSKDLHL